MSRNAHEGADIRANLAYIPRNNSAIQVHVKLRVQTMIPQSVRATLCKESPSSVPLLPVLQSVPNICREESCLGQKKEQNNKNSCLDIILLQTVNLKCIQ